MFKVSAIQCSLSLDMKENNEKILSYVEQAAKEKAHIVLPPELFQSHYFCKDEKEKYFDLAFEAKEHPSVLLLQKAAKQLKIAIPVSIYEREGPHYYNSLVMIDVQGEVQGLYRKSHIPDGPGYEEKFFFRPGNMGFKVWDVEGVKIGVGICWDQWFPECARAMMLMGAEILFYPTAIGSEPDNPSLETKNLWQRAMIGHAVSNVVPVVAANRIGLEGEQTFYGHSFISNHRGELVQEFDHKTSGLLTESFDLAEIRRNRAAFGFFRDRRPEFYTTLVKI